jgi:hypothetical protein
VRRHDLDVVSLVAGLLFIGFALAYLLVGTTDVDINARFVWPLVFVAFGAAGLATAIRANSREERAFADQQEESTPLD